MECREQRYKRVRAEEETAELEAKKEEWNDDGFEGEGAGFWGRNIGAGAAKERGRKNKSGKSGGKRIKKKWNHDAAGRL